jgi:endonuclease/exonuclease/phosphatase family metal-dependent hydrolase
MSAPKYLVVTQLCCDRDTQFAKRMNHCEDAEHTVAGYAACVGDHCPLGLGLGLFTGNLDGVVKITYSSKRFIPNSESVTFMGDDSNYISDHNGVELVVDARRPGRENAHFNIIAHNLEGLCYRNDPKKHDRFHYVEQQLVPYFKDHVRPGTIMLVQELALQIHKKDPFKQKELLAQNMALLIDKLKKINPNMAGVDDGYTGALVYDHVMWTPIRQVQVKRQDSNKYSNGYLMQFTEYPELLIWVVNIHLKAYGGGLKTRKKINLAHVIELSEIIKAVLAENTEDEYPIYLCGDFNNGTLKAEMIMEALRNVAFGYKLHYMQPPEDAPLTDEQRAMLAQAMME